MTAASEQTGAEAPRIATQDMAEDTAKCEPEGGYGYVDSGEDSSTPPSPLPSPPSPEASPTEGAETPQLPPLIAAAVPDRQDLDDVQMAKMKKIMKILKMVWEESFCSSRPGSEDERIAKHLIRYETPHNDLMS